MKLWRRAARIGAVVHGPEIVDSGGAVKLINYLAKFGSVKAVLGGTMGRLAVLDAGLENLISVSPHRRPSRSIQDLEPACDIIFLLCRSKSRESGLAFGSSVALAAGTERPLVQIDCGGGFVAGLAGKGDELAAVVAQDLGLDILRPLYPENVLRQGDVVKRTLRGVLPGEPISLNGTVIGRATDSSVELEARDGRIVGMRGADAKGHGLEKLPRIDLEKAIIRSGRIRRTEGSPRRGKGDGSGAAFIDHCAEEALEAAHNAALAVTIGDDTTYVAADILFRLGVPVIGIVDGDPDLLAGETRMLNGSMVITVKPGHDDLVGGRVKEELFGGQSSARLPAGELARRILEIAGDSIISVERI